MSAPSSTTCLETAVAIAEIDALLPQTQCTRCGYEGCAPYAQAVAAGAADINQCPPGGQATIDTLAALLRVPSKALNPSNGVESERFAIAVIHEPECIGCFKCVLVCPVDAIVGAPKFMHTVIAEQCSGCDLCAPVCPTDCITMIPRGDQLAAPAAMASRWRELFDGRNARHRRDEAHLEAERLQHRAGLLKDRASTIDIDAAIQRARARRQDHRSE